MDQQNTTIKPLTRDRAYEILTSLVKNQNLLKHHLACEAAMKDLYKRLNPIVDPEEKQIWGITGLLHDADYELSKNHPEKHTLILEEKIGKELDPKIMYAIKSHNYRYTKVEPKTHMDWSIYCCDELTGLIIACALVHPDKKLSSLTPEFVMKRYAEPSFARGASRGQISLCEQTLTIPLDEFVQIVLTSLQTIAPSLGL